MLIFSAIQSNLLGFCFGFKGIVFLNFQTHVVRFNHEYFVLLIDIMYFFNNLLMFKTLLLHIISYQNHFSIDFFIYIIDFYSLSKNISYITIVVSYKFYIMVHSISI